MNGNTYFNLRFYNPLPVQFAAADSEAHVTSGVTRRQSRIYFVDLFTHFLHATPSDVTSFLTAGPGRTINWSMEI